MSTESQKTPIILRQKQVQARTGLSRSTIYLRISQGIFPRQIKLGARSVGWLDSEIEQWIATRVAASRSLSSDKGEA